MGFLNDLFGGPEEDSVRSRGTSPVGAQRAPTEDELAVRRYQYLMDTAPPEDLEAVHREAFAKLSPKQREMLAKQLGAEAPPGEAPISPEPEQLAVAATRSEMRRPGSMARALSGVEGGRGLGAGGFMDSMFGTISGYVIASTLMSSFLPSDATLLGGDTSADAGTDATSDSAFDAGQDSAAVDSGFEGAVDASSIEAADIGFDPGIDTGFDVGDFGDFGF